MKELGSMYGAKLLLDTDDEQIFLLVQKNLNAAWKLLYPIRTEEELEKQIALITTKKP